MADGDAGTLIAQLRLLVGDGLGTPYDLFRASSSATGQAQSAHTILTSAGVSLVAVGASNQVRLKMLNLQLRNNQNQWLTVEIRDGLITGLRLFGPVTINPGSDLKFGPDDLMGRGATSAIIMQIVSGAVTGVTMVSGGVIATVGFVPERLDYHE